jgi:hypothetical protein
MDGYRYKVSTKVVRSQDRGDLPGRGLLPVDSTAEITDWMYNMAADIAIRPVRS